MAGEPAAGARGLGFANFSNNARISILPKNICTDKNNLPYQFSGYAYSIKPNPWHWLTSREKAEKMAEKVIHEIEHISYNFLKNTTP